MHPGQVRVATKRDQEARDKMRKAKGLLSIVAGLVLMFQAGTSVAYADDSKHKATAKTDDKAQVSAKAETKSSTQARASVSAGATAQTRTSTEQKSSSSSEQKASGSSSERASSSSSERASSSSSEKASGSSGEKASNSSSEKASGSSSEKASAPAKASSDQKSEAKTEQQTSGQEHTSNSPPGNNGDIKVHMITTAQSDHRNQPKPGCTFYIDGFNFDSHSSGQWRIDGQGQTSGSFGHGTWGPSDSGGNWRTEDRTLAEGHYKVSAWQTLPNDPSGGDKTKVFKIDCGTSGGAGEETRGQITAAIGGATTFNAALKSRVEAAVTLLASCTGLLPATALMLQGDITAATNASGDVTLKIGAAQTALDNLNIAIASGNAASIALAVTAAGTAMTNLQTSIDTATSAKATLNADFAGVASICGAISSGAGGTGGTGNTGGNGNEN